MPTISLQVHDRYVRRPLDLPWRGHPVRLRITVRRFRCGNLTCKRSTFAEGCGESLPRYARRTREANLRLPDFVQVAGGEGGARLASADRLCVSSDTLLRLQRGAFSSFVATPRALGVDDLALRRGQTYATIFVDLETHQPIDLVEGRDVKTLDHWLKAQPGAEVISRDRASEYAEGAKAGAPQAVQVADRFHLLVRRFIQYAIPVADGRGSEGDLWVNGLPSGESQRGQ